MHRDARLHDALEALSVRVEYVELPADRDGEYVHRLRLMRLRPGMSARLHRSVLAHETAHAVFGDEPSMFGPANARMERRADEWAALQLVDPDAYARAEFIHHGHIGAIAHDLGVVRSVIDTYQRILARVGDTVYVAPRMGAGQYAHRAEAS